MSCNNGAEHSPPADPTPTGPGPETPPQPPPDAAPAADPPQAAPAANPPQASPVPGTGDTEVEPTVPRQRTQSKRKQDFDEEAEILRIKRQKAQEIRFERDRRREILKREQRPPVTSPHACYPPPNPEQREVLKLNALMKLPEITDADKSSSKQFVDTENGPSFTDATRLTEHVSSWGSRLMEGIQKAWAAQGHRLEYFGVKPRVDGKKKMKRPTLAASVGNNVIGQLIFDFEPAVIIQEASTGCGVPETSISRLISITYEKGDFSQKWDAESLEDSNLVTAETFGPDQIQNPEKFLALMQSVQDLYVEFPSEGSSDDDSTKSETEAHRESMENDDRRDQDAERAQVEAEKDDFMNRRYTQGQEEFPASAAALALHFGNGWREPTLLERQSYSPDLRMFLHYTARMYADFRKDKTHDRVDSNGNQMTHKCNAVHPKTGKFCNTVVTQTGSERAQPEQVRCMTCMQVGNKVKKFTVCAVHANQTQDGTSNEVLNLLVETLRRPPPNKGKLEKNKISKVRQLIDSGNMTPLRALDSMMVRHAKYGFAVVEAVLPMTSAIAGGEEKVDDSRVVFLLKFMKPQTKVVQAMPSVQVVPEQSHPIRPAKKIRCHDGPRPKRHPTGSHDRVCDAAEERDRAREDRPKAVLDHLYQTAVGTLCPDSADGKVQLTGGWKFVNSELTGVCKRCRVMTSRGVGFPTDLDVPAMYNQECDRQNINTQVPLPDETSCTLTEFLGSDPPKTTPKVFNPVRTQHEGLWSETPVTNESRNKNNHVTPQRGDDGYESREESSDAEESMNESSADEE